MHKLNRIKLKPGLGAFYAIQKQTGSILQVLHGTTFSRMYIQPNCFYALDKVSHYKSSLTAYIQ